MKKPGKFTELKTEIQILVCPEHGPMSERDAWCKMGYDGLAELTCPRCGRFLKYVKMEDANRYRGEYEKEF